MYADSSSERPRKSLAVPIFHPFAAKRFFFSLRIVIFLDSPLACVDNRSRRLSALLAEDFQDHDGIRVDPIDDPPGNPGIVDAQFMTPWTQPRHGSGVGAFPASRRVATVGVRVPLPILLPPRTAESLFLLPTRQAVYPPKSLLNCMSYLTCRQYASIPESGSGAKPYYSTSQVLFATGRATLCVRRWNRLFTFAF